MTLEALAMQAIENATGQPAVTVEQVIRSRGQYFFADIVIDKQRYWGPVLQNVTNSAPSWYQHRPSLGFYCLYNKRPSDPQVCS